MGASPRSRGIVVVTGAGSGIGRATALLLAERGFDVVAGVHEMTTSARLGSVAGERIQVIQLDVLSSDDRAAAAESIGALTRRGHRLVGLVNSAGITVAGPMERFGLDDLRRTIEINLVGPIALTQLLLPMLRKSRGRVVNIGSRSARLALPFYGPYAASKAAVVAVSDAWRLELRPWRVPVIVVEPGASRTNIWHAARASAAGLVARDATAKSLYGRLARDVERNARKLEASAPGPETVAETILRALTDRHPRALYRTAETPATLAMLGLSALPAAIRDRLILTTLPSLRKRRK